mmetsp:Transcript_28202/g.66781  ORF Transcript_28202/g.66781 Transcript_28202/m.66781 type:complete len:131 (+) Transcript_28202:114-506(+)
MSSSWVPVSTTRPWLTTTMRLAARTVERRWAITSTVHCDSRSRIHRSMAACTLDSDSASKADVASSSNRTLGFLTRARAIATRCFCPPLSWAPFSPVLVWYPSVNSETKPSAFAEVAASTTCAMSHSFNP